MRSKQNILLCLFSIVAFAAYGQQEASEQMLWSNVHITKELPQSFSAKVKISYYSTMPMFSPRFIDAGLTHKVNKHLSFGLYYRFKSTFKTSQQRVYFETSYKKLKVEALGISLGTRFRVQHKLRKLTETSSISTYQMRPRFTVDKLLTNNLKAYSAIESFYSNQGKGTDYNFDRLRFDLGVSYKVLNTNHLLRVYYRYQADIDETEVLSMINIGYRFNF
ncbi:MAG: DUF2490 domain-containing protein [Saprospiraceae bacterium]